MGTFAPDPWSGRCPPRPPIPTGPGGIPVGSPSMPEAAGRANFLGPRVVSTTAPEAAGSPRPAKGYGERLPKMRPDPFHRRAKASAMRALTTASP